MKGWLRWLIVGAVDAVTGVATGNAAVAISASALSNTLIKDTESSTAKDTSTEQSTVSTDASPSKMPSAINPSYISLSNISATEIGYSTAFDYGYLHNQTIYNIFEKYEEEVYSFTANELVSVINKELSILTGESFELLEAQNAYVVEQATLFAAAAVDVQDYDEYLDNILKITPTSMHSEIEALRVLLDGMQYMDIETEADYASAALTILDNSLLSVKQKVSLSRGISIGNASLRLWTR